MLLPLGFLGDNTAVGGVHQRRVVEGVRVRRDELAAVLGGAVSDHDGRRVFVGHNHGGRGQPAAVRVGRVRLEGFLEHACVQEIAHLERLLLSTERNKVGIRRGEETSTLRRSLSGLTSGCAPLACWERSGRELPRQHRSSSRLASM